MFENTVLAAEVALVRSDELDSAVPMFAVVPGNEGHHPLARGLQGGEGPLGEAGAVLEGAKERLGEGVVVRDPRAAEGWDDTEFWSVASSVLPFIGDPLSEWSFRPRGWPASLTMRFMSSAASSADSSS